MSGRSTARRSPLLAAAVLVLMTVAGVLTFGVERPPDLAAVDPDHELAPRAAVAWIEGGADGDGSCVHVARPDGSTHQVTCGPSWDLVGWDERGILLRHHDAGGATLSAVDPRNGEEHRVGEARGPDEPIWSRGSGRELVGRSFGDEGRFQLRAADAPEVVVADLPAGSGYDLRWGEYAPDGHGVAFLDTADRLVFAPVDATGRPTDEPRVWVDDVDAFRAVWEGTEPSVDG